MVSASLISRLSQAVDQIEKRLEQNRPLKVVKVRRGYKEDPDAALDRHYAAHPEDQDANIVIYQFYDDEEMAVGARIAPRRLGQRELGREPINLPVGRLARVRYAPIATKFRSTAK